MEALLTLGELISTRLLSQLCNDADSSKSATKERLEKATVLYIHYATRTQLDRQLHIISEIATLLDALHGVHNVQLSSIATNAIHMTVWKSTGPGSGSADVEVAWCTVLRHVIFDNAGVVNKSRITRLVGSTVEGSSLSC